MSDELKRPLAALGVALVFFLIILGVKSSRAAERVAKREQEVSDLDKQIEDLKKLRDDAAAIRSQTGTELALRADERALLARALPKAKAGALIEQLRDIAQRHAVTGFDRARDVRDAGLPARPARLSKLTIQVIVTTDWPRLGGLVSEVRGLAPVAVIEEVSVHRAEDVALLGVRLVVGAFVADEGSAVTQGGQTRMLTGPSPFFLASEVASGVSRRKAGTTWTPPRTVLQGVLLAPSQSQVIVNDEAVFVGQSFQVGSDTVKVLSASETAVRFQSGEHTYERLLAPLGK